MVNRVSDFLGVTAESAGAVVERTFKDNGRPTAYIAGEEGSGAFVFGLRYGRGLVYMKNRAAQKVLLAGALGGLRRRRQPLAHLHPGVRASVPRRHLPALSRAWRARPTSSPASA